MNIDSLISTINFQQDAIEEAFEKITFFFGENFPAINIKEWVDDMEKYTEDDDEEAPGYGKDLGFDYALKFRNEKEFGQYKVIKEQNQGPEDKIYYCFTHTAVNLENLQDQFLNFFIDNGFGIKKIETKSSGDFSSLFFQVSYLDVELLFFKDIFSIKQHEVAMLSPHVSYGHILLAKESL